MSAAQAEAQQLFEAFKNTFYSEPTGVDECLTILPKLKIVVTKFPSLHPLRTEDISPKELLLARETYELATLLSVKAEDIPAFERHIAQTKTLYNDYSVITAQSKETSMPKSERQNLILGLNLLFLLSQNRMAEFHTELELIPLELHSTIFIQHPVQLEQYLMEGSYNKVVAAASQVPAESYKFFMDILVETVRDEIADCCERAYTSLRLADAQEMLMCDSLEALRQFVDEKEGERGWAIDESAGILVFESEGKADGVLDIPSDELIIRALEYAKELERIV
jgi:26S proteasome regulatory subunit N12